MSGWVELVARGEMGNGAWGGMGRGLGISPSFKGLFFKIRGLFWSSGVMIFHIAKGLFLGWGEEGLTIHRVWVVNLGNFYIISKVIF